MSRAPDVGSAVARGRRLNTVLFVLGATFFNIIATLIVFVVLLLLYANVPAGLLPARLEVWVPALFFLVAVYASFLVYRLLLKMLARRIRFGDWLAPLVGAKAR